MCPINPKCNCCCIKINSIPKYFIQRQKKTKCNFLQRFVLDFDSCGQEGYLLAVSVTTNLKELLRGDNMLWDNVFRRGCSGLLIIFLILWRFLHHLLILRGEKNASPKKRGTNLKKSKSECNGAPPTCCRLERQNYVLESILYYSFLKFVLIGYDHQTYCLGVQIIVFMCIMHFPGTQSII